FLGLAKLESVFMGSKSSPVGEKRDGLLLKGEGLVPESTRLPFAVSSSCLNAQKVVVMINMALTWYIKPLATASGIELFVNRLDSVESVLPYEYTAFDFCQAEGKKRPSENLGQVLFGERIEPSPYRFTFNKKEICKSVCTKTYDTTKPEDKQKLDFLKKSMLLNYQHH
ncbi:PREDICTED: transmembrane 9 superfamily member 2-like, partial [Nestor notabilis]|uniref:transmembrane 9 superfamily member 2-like n=1 Tax=Nestor notabilis TaxID=176057 RepID=UPI0005231192